MEDDTPSRRSADTEIAVLHSEFQSLTRVVAAMSGQIGALDQKIDRLAFVHPDVYLADRKAADERHDVIVRQIKALVQEMHEHKEDRKAEIDAAVKPANDFILWFYRLFAGGVITAAVLYGAVRN